MPILKTQHLVKDYFKVILKNLLNVLFLNKIWYQLQVVLPVVKEYHFHQLLHVFFLELMIKLGKIKILEWLGFQN
jgi:hypothetical protein